MATDDRLEINVVTDPGLTSQQALKAVNDIRKECRDWDLHVETQLLLMSPNHELVPPATALEDHEPAGSAQVTILVTELPRFNDDDVLVSEYFADDRIGIISYPGLGVIGSRRKLRSEILRILDAAQQNRSYTSAKTTKLRTMVGMIATNQPHKSLGALSGALAAGVGTGAFGIFYSSIWQMADYLTIRRLTVVNIVAILGMAAWLIIDNNLWSKARDRRFAKAMNIYNGSTAITVFLLVIGMYALLFGIIFIGGMAVIAPDFLADQLDKPVGTNNYLTIAWLAASMGVTAGALGSSFNSDADLKRMTHGARERQRLYSQERREHEDEQQQVEESHRLTKEARDRI